MENAEKRKPSYEELWNMVVLAHKYVSEGHLLTTGELALLRNDMKWIDEWMPDYDKA